MSMKEITLYFIKRPMLVNFILALNFIIGGYFIYKVPKEAFPGVSMNQIIIVTKYPGASSKDIELNVTRKIEEQIAEIGSIKEYRSSSIESVSRVTIFADDDLNLLQFRDLLSDVHSEIDKIDDFPHDIESRPVITSVTSEDRPIIEIALSGPYKILKTKIPQIENELRKVTGVSTVTRVGLPDEEIHIEVDAQKAIKKDIDLNTIYHAINTRNQVGTGGTLESFIAQKKIVSFNKYEKAEDVLNTIIRMSPDGQGVYLSEIAKIIYRPKDDKLIVRNNGERGASILIAIQNGVDQLKASDKIKDILLKEEFPEGTGYVLNNDVSNSARAKFALLKNNGIIGFVLVFLLLFYFLGRRSAFWTAFGIPFTVFGSMILFIPLGITLNSVSMGAFVIVLGMIVDDAMVISERFDFNLTKGQKPIDAASNAVDRLWRPVLASSLTTVIAFMPLLALGGLPGKFIWQMPTVVMIALFVSLIDCYILLPAHLAHGAKNKIIPQKNKIIIFIENIYEKVLLRLIDYRYLTLFAFMSLFIFSVFIGATKVRKDSFPQEASEGFSIKVTLNKGYAAEKVELIIKDIEYAISDLPEDEIIGYTSRLGTHSVNSLTNFGTEENLVAFLVYLTPYNDRERTANQIIDQIKSVTLKKFGSKGYDLEFDLMRLGPPLGEPFEIIVSSNDDVQRKSSSSKVISFLTTINGLTGVKDDYIPGKDEINLKLDYKKVAQAGLTPVDIIRTLRIAFDGQLVTDYSSIDHSYDFRLRLDKESRGDFDFISKLPIANNRGQLIRLNTMIETEERPSYAEIKHFNGIRSTSITGNINTNTITAVEMLNVFESKFTKDKNTKYTISGRPVEEAKIFSGLMIAAIMAVIGIFFILSLIFNSYVKPFLILLVIPFGVVGIFLSFYIHNLPLSMFAGIGLIGLAGIVVNDSIVLVDHLSQLMKDHGSFSVKLLIQGSKERLRPITLTTISTILAVAPTAYAIGGYDPLLSPLSLAILYGLIVGTTVVLLLMPILYVIGNDVYLKLRKNSASRATTLVFFISLFMLGMLLPKPANAQDNLNLNTIVKILENSLEYKIQNENLIQAEYSESGVDGMLDGKLSTKLFKSTSENYPNPPISLDSKRDSYGLSVDYQKMTSYGFKFGIGMGYEDKSLETTPSNNQFSLNAMDTVYKSSLIVPLWRNFASKEFHYKKNIAALKKNNVKYKSKFEKDIIIRDALVAYWTLVKLYKEKDIAKNTLSRFKSLHKLNVIKRKSGIISESELLTSEVEINNRQKNSAEIISKIEIEKIKLKMLLETDGKPNINISEMRASALTQKLSKDEVQKIIRDGLVSLQSTLNQDIAKSLLKLEKEINKSNLDFFISLKSFGRGDNIQNSLEENTYRKYEVYAGLSWDFDVGNVKSNIDINNKLSQIKQAFLKQKQLDLKLSNTFSEIKQRVNLNVEQVFYLNKISKQQQKILKVEKQRFKNGKITTLDYIKLQEAYDRSLLQIINLEYLNENLSLKLFSAVGKLDIYLSQYN